MFCQPFQKSIKQKKNSRFLKTCRLDKSEASFFKGLSSRSCLKLLLRNYYHCKKFRNVSLQKVSEALNILTIDITNMKRSRFEPI